MTLVIKFLLKRIIAPSVDNYAQIEVFSILRVFILKLEYYVS